MRLDHAGQGAVVFDAFGDDKLTARRGGNLGQMGNAEHLMRAAKSAHFCTDFRGDLSADIGVDLIENKDRHIIFVGKNALESEHDTRDLSAGRNRAQRAWRLPRIAGKQKFRRLIPVGARAVQALECNEKIRSAEAQRLEAAADFIRKLF